MINNEDYLLCLHKEAIKCHEQMRATADTCYDNVEFTKCVYIHNLIEIEIARRSKSISSSNSTPRNSDADHVANKECDQNNKSNDIMSTQIYPKVSGLEEIAGLANVKKILKTKILLPLTQPQLFYGRKACNTILLYGPPGTGKTRIVHAIAAEVSARFHSIAWSDILSKYIGETEKKISSLFETVKSSTNTSTILFIDEIDGLCRKRSANEEEWIRRLKTELLSQITAFEDRPNVFLICATNCPWDLDSAFFRRFEQRIYIPLPNSSDRFDLFQLFAKNTPLESPSNLWQSLLDKTEGFSGSDISNLVSYALNIPVMELTENFMWHKVDDKFTPIPKVHSLSRENIICCDLYKLPPQSVQARCVKFKDLFQALHVVKKTVREEDLNKYKEFDGSL